MFIISSICIFSALSFVLGIILSYSESIFRCEINPVIEQINDCLPQSQCGQCGYASCYLYAEAIINKKESIDKCLPGGKNIIYQLSDILNIQPPRTDLFLEQKKTLYTIALIDEKNCVGCSKCAFFCPVDAIVGAPDYMHTVLRDFCTGCNICTTHCPTNCITMKTVKKVNDE